VPTNMSTDWFTTSPVWSAKGDDHKSILLSTRNNLNPIPDVTLADIIEKSTNFPIEFPTESVRCRQLLKNKIPEVVLEKNLLSVSSHTCFVNDGNRRNEGVFEEDRKKVEEDGVIIGNN
jgi:hypothetical protein